MTFPVSVTYMNRNFTYDVETTDGRHFVCKRQLNQDAEDHGAPPEVIELEKGERPTHYEAGQYKVQLHTDLMDAIENFLRSDA